MIALAGFAYSQQTTYTGVSMTGLQTGQGAGGLDRFGVVNLFDAGMGTFKDPNNKLTYWGGRRVSPDNWKQYVTTAQPWATNTFSTNNFPAIIFDPDLNGSSQNLRNDRWGMLSTGNSNFSLMFLVCAQTNNANSRLFGMGWGAATNNNASRVDFRPHSTTISNTVVGISYDTNQAVTQVTLNLNSPTNVYRWMAMSRVGTNITVMNNLRALTVSVGSGVLTLDEAVLGGSIRNGAVVENIWKGALTVASYSSNGLDGTSLTNWMDYMNVEYRNGIYKVY